MSLRALGCLWVIASVFGFVDVAHWSTEGLYASYQVTSLPSSKQRSGLHKEEPKYLERMIGAAGQPLVHSATLAWMSATKELYAYWYGGSREGARDVAIYTAKYRLGEDQWSEPKQLLTTQRVQVQLQRFIKKLGNPVAFTDAEQRIWLFFVTVSVGGWAGSAVNYMVSDDGGQSFGPIQRLVTTPFLNISTLVKNHPVMVQNGNIVLPVYHEFMGKFAELLLLSDQGQVLTKKRLTWGRDALQPVLLPLNEQEAVVYMRFAGIEPNRILYVATQDAGVHFSKPTKLALPNPNAAVAAVRLNSQELLMVYNNSLTHRNVLSLSFAEGSALAEGSLERWFWLYDFERTENELDRFSYPVLLQDDEGSIHVMYSYNRRNIKHVEFNEAWLRQQVVRHQLQREER